MKFGFRKPSVKRRIAARTSVKRLVRNNLGLKAPRGWGWVTNPKKAAYNRAYNRTTFGFDSGRSRSHSSSATDGGGCLIVAALLTVVGVFGLFIVGQLGWAVVPLGLVFLVAVGVVYYLYAKSQRRLDEAKAQQIAQAKHARFAHLAQRFGDEAAGAIMQGRYWQGCTMEMVVEAIGPPVDIKERVLKTKTKTTYCYNQLAKNRFALKVYFENGVVVGWHTT